MASRLSYIWRDPWVNLIARLVFAAALLALLFTRVDFASVLNALRLIRPTSLVPSLVIHYSVQLVLAYQMSFGLDPLGIHLGVWDLFKIKLIASFYSLLLPGDLVAGGVMWHRLSRPNGKGVEAGALLLYFRLVDTLVLLAIGSVGLCFDPVPISSGFRAVVAAAFLGVIILLLPFCSPSLTRLVERHAGALLRNLSLPVGVRRKGRTAWEAVLAFQMLSNVRSGIIVLSLSLLTHALGVASYYLIARAVGIHLSVFTLGWIRSVLCIVQMVPVSIAGLGVREGTIVLLLRNYGILEPQALSLSLVIFGVMILGGSVGCLLEGWDLCLGSRRSRQSVSVREADEGTTHVTS